jgi:16S rRNA (cytosine1407-C5)-methyltransferase
MSRKLRKKKKHVLPTHIPQEFFGRLEEMFGDAKAQELQKTFVEKPTTFRINTFRASEQDVLGVLHEQGFLLDAVPWQKGAYILRNKEKRDICDLPVYTECQIYLQSLASMVPPLVLDPQPGERVLDLTAAPGSKTSQMAEMMNRTGELVANDKNKIRFFKLKHNMEQLGVLEKFSPSDEGELEGVDGRSKNIHVPTTPPQPSPYKGEGADWKLALRMEPGTKLVQEYDAYFDKILLDAPCSSEARFVSTNPKTFGYWKERKVKEMAYTQRELLLSAWKALRPGGVLVYSTCTYAPEENECQISRLLERMPDAETVPIDTRSLATLPILTSWRGKALHPGVVQCLRVYPTADIEGFFIAKVRKRG